MNPLTQDQAFLQSQIERLIDEQKKTNELLSQIIPKEETKKNITRSKKGE
jgi:hypothetical protein